MKRNFLPPLLTSFYVWKRHRICLKVLNIFFHFKKRTEISANQKICKIKCYTNDKRLANSSFIFCIETHFKNNTIFVFQSTSCCFVRHIKKKYKKKCTRMPTIFRIENREKFFCIILSLINRKTLQDLKKV